MPKTRQQLAARGHSREDGHQMEDPVEETNRRSRRAFVSIIHCICMVSNGVSMVRCDKSKKVQEPVSSSA